MMDNNEEHFIAAGNPAGSKDAEEPSASNSAKDDENEKERGKALWHEAGELLIEFLVRSNAHAKRARILRGLRVQYEEPLCMELGKDARKAGISIVRPDAVKVARPIGEFLGMISIAEYESPKESCTKVTLARNGIYVLEEFLRSEERDIDFECELASIAVCFVKPKKLFEELNADKPESVKHGPVPGIYDVEMVGPPKTRIVVTWELEYDQNGYVF